MSVAIMTDLPLFEDLDVPVVMDDPRGPATRFGDPIQSHRAADRSQATAPVVRARVLHILAYRGRRMTGNEINTEYAARWGTGPNNSGFDSPRKRAGELVAAGLLARDDHGVYSITDKGLETLR